MTSILSKHIQVMVIAMSIVLLGGLSPRAYAADVSYISGGVGADERSEFTAKERDYNLKVVAAENSGDFLANIQVVIESAKKGRVLEAKMDGPILLAKLAPGTYTIKATFDDRTLVKSVIVPAQGLPTVDFRWPSATSS